MGSPRREIVDLGLVPEFRVQYFPSVGLDQPGDLAVRVVQVAEDPGIRGAGIHTGRVPSLSHPVTAEVAFGCDPDTGFLFPGLLGEFFIRR